LKLVQVFSSDDGEDGYIWGWSQFLERSLVESLYLSNGWVTFLCNIIVLDADTIVVPPSNMGRDLSLLLDSKAGADVSFTVKGETIQAHRAILAARSPVFEAELYGSSSTTETDDAHTVTVRDMRPDTFRALLHFIYTDSLPAMSHLSMDEMRELVQHLLAAADRYAVDRLKVMCEHILARTLHVENAAITLALADRHDCDRLKHASIHFMASSADKSEWVMM